MFQHMGFISTDALDSSQSISSAVTTKSNLDPSVYANAEEQYTHMHAGTRSLSAIQDWRREHSLQRWESKSMACFNEANEHLWETAFLASWILELRGAVLKWHFHERRKLLNACASARVSKSR